MKQSDAQRQKYQGLAYLRNGLKCAFLATEVGAFSADILGASETRMVEIEVKSTMADLKADAKKYKHYEYHEKGYGAAYQRQWVPNQFYYAIPTKLIPKAKEYIESRWPNYGLIDLAEWKIHRRAKWLHKNKPNDKVKFRIALRMGTELIRFHEAWI